jgi:hypothetical protein
VVITCANHSFAFTPTTESTQKSSIEKTTRVVKNLTSPYPRWANLTAEQQRILYPLRDEWSQLTEIKQRKWIEIAGRYPNMSPNEQQRIQDRMIELVKLSPEQRRELRDTFKEVKTLPADDKSAKWERYQQLSDEQKAQFRANANPNNMTNKDKLPINKFN